MSKSDLNFNLEVQGMKTVCPLGEVIGAQMIDEKKSPYSLAREVVFAAKYPGLRPI